MLDLIWHVKLTKLRRDEAAFAGGIPDDRLLPLKTVIVKWRDAGVSRLCHRKEDDLNVAFAGNVASLKEIDEALAESPMDEELIQVGDHFP